MCGYKTTETNFNTQERIRILGGGTKLCPGQGNLPYNPGRLCRSFYTQLRTRALAEAEVEMCRHNRGATGLLTREVVEIRSR